MPELAGRTAIVTGGVTKIGQGVVAALRDAGATVIVADIDPDGSSQAEATRWWGPVRTYRYYR